MIINKRPVAISMLALLKNANPGVQKSAHTEPKQDVVLEQFLNLYLSFVIA